MVSFQRLESAFLFRSCVKVQVPSRIPPYSQGDHPCVPEDPRVLEYRGEGDQGSEDGVGVGILPEGQDGLCSEDGAKMGRQEKSFRVRLAVPDGAGYADKQWRGVWAELPNSDLGEVNYDDKTITLRPNQEPEEILGTAWHEAIHVAAPYLNEEAVLIIEYNIRQMDAAVRQAMGYDEY